jgi:hypothetical protein
MSPYESTDLTDIVVIEENAYVVLRSPETADHRPKYVELARFPSMAEAMAFIAREYGERPEKAAGASATL